MFEAFGPFEALFTKGRGSVPAYLALLNIDDAAFAAMQLLDAIEDSAVQLPAYLEAMLDEVNWRPQLIAAAVLAVTRSPDGVLDRVWALLDRQCWVSPQVAAAASRVDPRFADHARIRMERRCRLDDPDRRVRSVAAGVAYVEPYDEKLMGALAALCAPLPDARAWLTPLLAAPDVGAMLGSDRSAHGGGALAVRWLNGLDAAIEAARRRSARRSGSGPSPSR